MIDAYNQSLLLVVFNIISKYCYIQHVIEYNILYSILYNIIIFNFKIVAMY